MLFAVFHPAGGVTKPPIQEGDGREVGAAYIQRGNIYVDIFLIDHIVVLVCKS